MEHRYADENQITQIQRIKANEKIPTRDFFKLSSRVLPRDPLVLVGVRDSSPIMLGLGMTRKILLKPHRIHQSVEFIN